MGLAAALLLLVGGSIAFASQAFKPDASGRPAASFEPPPAPSLLAPGETLTQAETIDLTVVRPVGLSSDHDYVLRVFVNEQLARERPLPAQEQFQLTAVPLVQGVNSIRAAVVGDGVEGALSAPISVERDDIAPVIRVFHPEPDATVYSDSDTLRGKTEAGASMSVVDLVDGQTLETTVQPDGRFESILSLALGTHRLLLHSRDAAGNEASTRIVLVRAESLAALTLTISANEMSAADLPKTLGMVAIVQDEQGQPADGVEVTFSLSPPNATTMTYRTTAVAGRASWPAMVIKRDDDPLGTWLVTVLAVLPSGAELRDDESLIVR